MTRLEKPFPLEVTWGFPSRCKHSWLPLESYWGFLESEGGIVTFKLYLAPEWVIWQTLESDQPAWLRSRRWQADSVSFALCYMAPKLHLVWSSSTVFDGSHIVDCFAKYLLPILSLNLPLLLFFFFFLHDAQIHKMGHLYTQQLLFPPTRKFYFCGSIQKQNPILEAQRHMQMWLQWF